MYLNIADALGGQCFLTVDVSIFIYSCDSPQTK